MIGMKLIEMTDVIKKHNFMRKRIKKNTLLILTFS